MNKDQMTHFGFQSVLAAEKPEKVAQVFTSVANQYDLMNDLMSWGLHRLWKQIAIYHGQVRPNQRILDLAGGSGDLSIRLSSLISSLGQIILADINSAMLNVARQKILDQGLHHKISLIQADAEQLPFPDNYFDRIFIGFGLRNVTHQDRALEMMNRVLKPGGRLIILEFSKTTISGLKQCYDYYSFHCLPKLGQWIAQDAQSYQYLAESIRMHPDAETLKTMLITAGFDEASYYRLLGGIVAIHIGVKF